MRYRRWLLALVPVLLLAVAGIIVRTSTYREELTWAERAVYEAVAPLQSLANGAVRSVRSWIESFVELRHVQAENERLRAEIAALRAERDALLEAGRQNEALRELLELTRARTEELAVAEIIARSPSNWLESITINKGRSHGVEPGMAVVAPEGAVGKVRYVTETTAEVVLITDARSSAGGRVRDTGHLVLVEGTSNPTDELLKVTLLTWEAQLNPGDVIVASELSRIFPKGLPIGVVEWVAPPESGLIPWGMMRPFVDLSRLEWVIVVKKQEIDAPWWEE